MGEAITKESNADRWNSMMAIWVREKKPGYLVVGNKTYTVLRLPGDVIEFREDRSNQEFYEHTSL